MDLSRNRGGISGGDRSETGDLEARPNEGTGPGGSGVRGGDGGASGNPTASTDALSDASTDDTMGVAELSGDSDLEDLTIHNADDPDLGLTDIGNIPAEDWAANTGPTRSGEAASHGVDRELVDNDRMPGGRRVDMTSTSTEKDSRK